MPSPIRRNGNHLFKRDGLLTKRIGLLDTQMRSLQRVGFRSWWSSWKKNMLERLPRSELSAKNTERIVMIKVPQPWPVKSQLETLNFSCECLEKRFESKPAYFGNKRYYKTASISSSHRHITHGTDWMEYYDPCWWSFTWTRWSNHEFLVSRTNNCEGYKTYRMCRSHMGKTKSGETSEKFLGKQEFDVSLLLPFERFLHSSYCEYND